MIKIIEQMRHTFGKRVVLDTPLSLTTVDTDIERLGPDGSLGAIVSFELSVMLMTRIAEDNPEAFHHSREQAARYVCQELYGEIVHKLRLIQLEIYQTNPQGFMKVSSMLDDLMRDMKP